MMQRAAPACICRCVTMTTAAASAAAADDDDDVRCKHLGCRFKIMLFLFLWACMPWKHFVSIMCWCGGVPESVYV